MATTPSLVELETAAEWWSLQIKGGQEQTTAFKDALMDEMVKKYSGHWYPEDQKRGSGFRSISNGEEGNRIDPMLRRAALAASIAETQLAEDLRPTRNSVMFVNPNSVRISRYGENGVLVASHALHGAPLPAHLYGGLYTGPDSSPMLGPTKASSILELNVDSDVDSINSESSFELTPTKPRRRTRRGRNRNRGSRRGKKKNEANSSGSPSPANSPQMKGKKTPKGTSKSPPLLPRSPQPKAKENRRQSNGLNTSAAAFQSRRRSFANAPEPFTLAASMMAAQPLALRV